MSSLMIIAILVLGIQVILFFMIRAKKGNAENTSELEKKYHIHSRADAWKLLNNPEIPEAERAKIENLYRNM